MAHEDNVRPVTKQANEVFWRWFYISNWGPMTTAPRLNHREHIARVVDFYNPKFREKATIEIIHGNTVEVVAAKDLPRGD